MISLTEEQAGRLLVGSKVEISVGEPWDFSSADGDNTLKGNITEFHQSEDQPGGQEVHIQVTPFEAKEGVTVDRLVATRRYRESSTIVGNLAAGEAAEVNFGYADQVPEGYEDPEGSPFLIGGFTIASE